MTGEGSCDLVSEEESFAGLLSKAIQDKEAGLRRSYDKLCAELKEGILSDERLLDFIVGIKGCCHQFTKEHETFVSLFLKLDWISRNPEIVAQYRDAVIDLLSNQIYFCNICVCSLVLKVKVLSSSEKESSLLWFQHIHSTLAAILRVVPTCANLVFDTFAKNFPYMNKSATFITRYVENLLFICKYCPGLTQKILNLLIDNMLKIDVAISREELLLVVQSSNDTDTQFNMDLGEGIQNIKNLSKSGDLGMKLDGLMTIVFKHIQECCFQEKQRIVNHKSARLLFSKLEECFSSIILATFNCSHVPFVMFYISSLDESLSERFLQLCWNHIQDPSVPVFFSQIACAYLGGMLTRAKYVTLFSVKKWLCIVVDFLHKYIDNQDSDVLLLPTKHKLFYQLSQHAFYVVIFHHADMCSGPEGVEFLKKLNFERIVMSRLNPLRFCLTSVADLFARVARFYQIAFCYTVLERNKRATLQSTASDLSKKETQIHNYFPFEPYLLGQSKTYIEPIYRHWEGFNEDSDQGQQIGEDHLMDEVVRSFENRFIIHLSQKYPGHDTDMAMSPSFGYEMH